MKKIYFKISFLCLSLLLGIASVSGQNNIVSNTLDCSSSRPPFSFDIQQRWSATNISPLCTPLAADLDGDGLVEILASGDTNGGIRIFDGKTGTKVGDINITLISNTAGVNNYAVVDVDGDGKAEIFAVQSNANPPKAILYEMTSATGARPITYAVKWSTNLPTEVYTNSSMYGQVPFIADLDGDGKPEFLTGRYILETDGSIVATLNFQGATVPSGSMYMDVPIAVDLDRDSIPEVVVGTDVYKYNGTTKTATLWKRCPSYSASGLEGANMAADINLDGKVDLVFHDTRNSIQGTLVIWTPETNTVIGTINGLYQGWRCYPVVGDIDGVVTNGKKYPEIVYNGQQHMVAYTFNGSTFSQKWDMATNETSGLATFTYFDFNNDGVIELVYRDEQNLKIYNATGSAPQPLYSMPATSGTLIETPIVADVTGDGSANIIVTGSGNLYVFEGKESKWASCPSIWNQQMYSAQLINTDLTVISHVASPAWDEVDCNGAHPRYFNGGPMQVPYISEETYCPFDLAPDVYVVSGSIQLSGSNVILTVTFGNQGMANIPANTPIRYYKNAISSANMITSANTTLGAELAPGQTVTVIKTLPGVASESQFFVRIVDDGANFPALGAFSDCNLTNNTQSFGTIEIKKVVSEQAACLGGTSYFTIEVINNTDQLGHPQTFNNVIITDSLGLGWQYLSSTADAGTISAYNSSTRSINWTIPSFAPSDTVHLYLQAKTLQAGAIRNSTWVAGHDGIAVEKQNIEAYVIVNSHTAPGAPTISPASPRLSQAGTVVLTANTSESGITSYQWYKDGAPIAGATNQTYTATEEGIYTVTYNNGTCTSEASLPTTVLPAIRFKTVTYNGNGSDGGAVPADATQYNDNQTVTVKDKGNLTKTGAKFLGWTFTPKALITKAADVPPASELKVAGNTFVITSDTTLYAVWAKDTNGPTGGSDDVPDYEEYGIKYKGDGSTSGTPPVDNNIYPSGGTAIVKDSATLAKTGYVFIGWDETPQTVETQAQEDALTITKSGTSITITDSVTFYPVWAKDASGPNGGSDGIPDYKQFAVIYDGNGSTAGAVPTDGNLYNSGNTVTLKPQGTLARTGAKFLGWSKTQSGLVTTAAQETAAAIITGGSFVITANTTLYAVWAEDNNGPGGGSDDVPDYKENGVTYDANGSTGGTAPTDPNIYDTGDKAEVKDKNTLVHDDAVFIGWSETQTPVVTVETDEPTLIQPHDSIAVTNDVTLYAVWAEDKNGPDGTSDGIPDYKENGITYNDDGADGGDPPVDNNLYYTGDSATVKDGGTLTKDSATFIGWTTTPSTPVVTTQTDEDGITIIEPGSKIEVNGPIDLYPVWAEDKNGPDGTGDGVPDYKQAGITYNANGSTSGTAPVDPNIYNMGDNATVKGKGDLEHTGAVFIGWSTSATSLVTTSAAVPSTLYQPNDPITVTGAITLYAVWAEDVNGPNGTSDGVPDYLEYGITYSNNGSTGGAAPVDPNIYKTGDNITIKDEGSLVKTNYTFIGWSESIEALVTSQSQEDAISLIDPGSTMQVGTSPITLYPVWAADDDNNGIPNYKQIKITYDKGMGTTATGFPQIKPAVKNSTITLTKQGGSYSGYVLIGWSTTKIVLLTTNALYTLNKSKILSLGDSYDIGTLDVTLYAVWGKDANNDGKVDFDSSIGSQSGTQNAQTKQKDLLEPNVINLRKFEVPDRLPNWDDNYDKPADNDDVYYTGCTYRQFGYMAGMSINPLYRLREPVLLTDGIFNNVITYITTPMNLIIEYDGVLRNKSIIGGKAQKALDKIEITAAMIASSSSIIGQPGYPVDSVLDAYSFTIMEDAITEDGVGIVKIYFIDPATGTYPTQTDFQTTGGAPMSSAGAWPKPFRNPETGSNSDVMTYKFNVYNKPVFKDSIIRQYADPNGYLHDLEVISGTPLKYMMRSIQERRWIQADLPLTADEIFVMDDAGSICLREMDENIGVSANTKDYYKSDRYAYDAHGNRDGTNAQVWIETFVLDSFFRADYLPFEIAHSSSLDPAWGPTGHPSTYISSLYGTGGCNSFADIYALEYQEYYDF